MNAKEAVGARIIELCKQNDIAVNSLANIAGIPPSTIYSMLNEKSKNPGVVTLREFFDSDIFDNIEQEIK